MVWVWSRGLWQNKLPLKQVSSPRYSQLLRSPSLARTLPSALHPHVPSHLQSHLYKASSRRALSPAASSPPGAPGVCQWHLTLVPPVTACLGHPMRSPNGCPQGSDCLLPSCMPASPSPSPPSPPLTPATPLSKQLTQPQEHQDQTQDKVGGVTLGGAPSVGAPGERGELS